MNAHRCYHHPCPKFAIAELVPLDLPGNPPSWFACFEHLTTAADALQFHRHGHGLHP